MRPAKSARLPQNAGIALGPILFMLAVLAIIGAVISAGGSGFSTASVADRVSADTVAQANLILSKINECVMLFGSNTNYYTYPQASTATPVSSLTCPGDGLNIWSGNRPVAFPPPTAGFSNATNLGWYYINTNAGGTNAGVCIWIQPNASSGGIVQGLTHAASKFTTVTVNDGASQVNYNPALTNQRFVVWISVPPASGTNLSTNNPNCMPQ